MWLECLLMPPTGLPASNHLVSPPTVSHPFHPPVYPSTLSTPTLSLISLHSLSQTVHHPFLYSHSSTFLTLFSSHSPHYLLFSFAFLITIYALSFCLKNIIYILFHSLNIQLFPFQETQRIYFLYYFQLFL